jgi:hypothetical protein
LIARAPLVVYRVSWPRQLERVGKICTGIYIRSTCTTYCVCRCKRSNGPPCGRPVTYLKGEREVQRKTVTRPLDQGEQQLRAKTRRSAPPESPLVRLGRMTGLHGALSGREYAGKGGSGARPAAGCNSIATPPSRQRPRPRTDNVVKCEHPGADRTWGQLLAGWYLGRRSRRRAEGWTEMLSW